MTRLVRWALAVLLAIGAAGCGDPALWTRWRVERAWWQAGRDLRRIELQPGLATALDYERAARRLDRIERLAPIERWTAPGAPGDPAVAREVAVLAGRALVRRAELDLVRARPEEGRRGLERAFERGRAVPEVAREAARALAVAHDRAARGGEALVWWGRLARDFAPYDSASGAPVEAVLEAAGTWAQRAQADSGAALLAGVEQRMTAAMTAPGAAPRERAWRALATFRVRRGDAAGAMNALRAVVPHTRRAGGVAALVLDLGRTALEAGWPDTARAYAAWASGLGREPNREALWLTARAWEAAGERDSALAAWSRLIEAHPKAQDSASESRFRRGVLLEELGRWETARSEYRALVSAQPSHPLSFEAQLRIVRHHLRIGEPDLARHEAQRLVEAMDYLIATQHDDGVQRAARLTRGEALRAAGQPERAFEALSSLWGRWPAEAEGLAAAWQAVALADDAPGLRGAADSLLADVALRAADPTAREQARSRLGRGR